MAHSDMEFSLRKKLGWDLRHPQVQKNNTYFLWDQTETKLGTLQVMVNWM